VLSVGYDKKILLWDVEKAQQPLQTWTHTNYVTCICPHPSDPNVFLVGTTTESGHNSGITCYDQRNPNAIKEYKRHFGGVLDLVFLPSGKEFLSSCMLQSTSTTDRSLLIWDFESTTLLQDQISMDLSMFPSLSLHPLKPLILAQSNFQHTRVLSYKPSINKWKFLQKKRFSSGHEVDNLRIKCSVNSNGQLLATGDTKGRLVVYDFETTKVLQCFSHAPSQKAACLGGVFHPLNPSLLASYGQDGTIGIYLC
jgi:pre-mRNA-processing factor 17